MTDQSTQLKFTGERFLPNEAGEMWAEHWHRYHYVLPFVAGKRVLDVACGEGYGSALMSKAASHVAGVDVAHEAIAHASQTYVARSNLEFVEASCTKLPFPDAAFDVVVSFETIEHITGQVEFLDEIKRVLRADGVLIISSPNKAEYSDARGYANEFHVKELYRDELAALIDSRFAHSQWLSQRNGFYSVIAPNTSTGAAFEAHPESAGETITLSKALPEIAAATLPPLYFIVIASNDSAALTALTPRTSAFTDSEEWAMKDYYMAYREWRKETAKREALERENAELKKQLQKKNT
jgi:ubiquinone/menaquinone biosynthesis C-methylase UbiE